MIYTILGVSTVFNAIVCLVTGAIVYFRNKENPINRTFTIFCLFMTVWAIGYFFPFTPDSKELSLLSFQILHAGAIFVSVAHFHFICAILKIEKQKRRIIQIGYLSQLFFLLFVPTNFFIADMVPKYDFTYWADVGPMYSAWLITWGFYIFYSLYLLFCFYQKTSGIQKKQIGYILIGDIITFSFGSTNFFLFYDINVPPYLTILASGQVITFAYAIIRYRFFDFQKNLFRVFRNIFSLFLALFILYWIYQLAAPINSDIQIMALFIIGVLVFIFLKHLFNSRVFHKIFRLTNFDQFEKVIDTFRSKLKIYPNLAHFQKEIETVFRQKLNISSAKIVLLTEKEKKKYSQLIRYFVRNKKYVVKEEMEFICKSQKKKCSFLGELSVLGAVCFPLFHGKNIVGFFVLGHKPFENPYTKDELELLDEASHYITLSLLSIIYNAELQKEVEEKTQKLSKQKTQLQVSNKKLKELDHLKDSFLSVASHELRTPMTVIKGYSDFLLSGKFGTLTDKQAEFLTKIFRNTGQLLKLVNDILDLSKLDAERMSFEFSDVNIKQFLREDALSNFQLLCEQKGITLTLQVEKGMTKMKTDPDKIKRIMNNLVGNAYKFTPKGGSIKVSVQKADKNDMVRFEVADSGIGIAKENQELVFEKFGQVDNYLQKSYDGTGLGLPIVKKIIQKLGGKIWVESEPGKGAHFIFLIPRLQHA